MECSMKIRVAELLPAGHHFLCPILCDVMKDPVCVSSGNTYERSAIEKWLQDHDTNPMTGARLANKRLVPNTRLKQQISQWEADQRSTHEYPQQANRQVTTEFDCYALKPGDLIDVKDEVGVWSEAEVIEVSEGSAAHVRVHYLYFKPKYDEWVDVESKRVAARGSHIFLGHDVHVGFKLRVLQRVDAFDIHPVINKWMEARIVEVDEDTGKLKLHWWNYHDKFDEWLDLTSNRLAPFGRYTNQS
jgi:hypothetical protein